MSARLRTACAMILALAAPVTAEKPRPVADRFAYLPPRMASRVVFYQSFEEGIANPEINIIGARVEGLDTAPISGLNGRGYRCPVEKDQTRYSLQSPALSPDRPLTVMVWWRLDRSMTMTTGFNVLTLQGKGLIGSFVRGKGRWCALPEPRRIFQVYYFEGIANRNDTYSERILLAEDVWHHTAITVSAASDITVFWDGDQKTSYSIRGRPFRPGDTDQLHAGLRHGTHPMSIDEVVVLDVVLPAAEIRAYVTSARRLAEINVPAVLP